MFCLVHSARAVRAASMATAFVALPSSSLSGSGTAGAVASSARRSTATSSEAQAGKPPLVAPATCGGHSFGRSSRKHIPHGAPASQTESAQEGIVGGGEIGGGKGGEGGAPCGMEMTR